MSQTVTCPSCGAQTSGKFCSECGTPLGDRSCANCGAKLSAKSKFCPECGTPTPGGGDGGGGAKGRPAGAPPPARVATPAGGLADKFPWIIAGLAVLALVATIIVVVTKKNSPPAGGTENSAAGGGGQFDPNRATTDISQMSPKDAADRLYERVARAAAAGDSGQITFFGPMTLQAYGSVTPLDPDSRLHIGLVDMYIGNAAGAIAQADTIARQNSTHLFSFVLKAQAAQQRNQPSAMRTAYQGFLRNYDAEMRKNLPEYQQHQALLSEVHTAAQGGGRP